MHVLIVGMTGSGKTTMAKRLCRAYRAKGIKSIVLDPLHDPGWPADAVTSDPERFLEWARLSQQCALFIDESGEMIGHYEKQMFWLATRSRHYGHKAHFITQRANQLSPTVRDQCSNLIAFAMSHQDCQTLAREFNKDEILQCKNKPKLIGLHCDRFELCNQVDLTKEFQHAPIIEDRSNRVDSDRDGVTDQTGNDGDENQ